VGEELARREVVHGPGGGDEVQRHRGHDRGGNPARAGPSRAQRDEEGGDGGGADPIVVPPIDEAAVEVYAQKIGEDGLLPKVKKAFDESDKDTLFRVEPEPGTELQPGATVTLFVSAGFPELAFDNDRDVLLVNGANGKALDPVAEGSPDEHDPTWSPDGSAIAYASDGQVFLASRERPEAKPDPLTKEGERFTDLAWAPTTDENVIAMAKQAGGKSDLCLGAVGRDGMTTRCKDEPGISIERKINWAPNGRSLLAWGFKEGTSEFGMVRWTTKRAFSSNPRHWSEGEIVTPTSEPGEGVLDAAISPDGKRMAVVQLGGNGRPELFMAKPGDFQLAKADQLRVRACKVIWRPDGEELVVVRADDCIRSATGDLLRFPAADPSDQQQLKLGGDNPAFQPLPVE
jgi:dipeptidyl aminopeptidase/acylaminoacyl peptidase